MARPNKLDGAKLAQALDLAKRGTPLDEIATTMGVSRRTIQRVLLGATGPQRVRSDKAPPAPSSAEALPVDPDQIPEGTSLDQLDRWIAQADIAARKAQAANNVPLMGQMLRVASSLAETRRKATPVALPDPNDHPDMVQAAKRAREMLHRLVDSAVGA